MTVRLALGQRTPGVYGFHVSKPTFNVITCGNEDLLLSTNKESFQLLYNGTATNPSSTVATSTVSVTVPDVGFTPMFIVTSPFFNVLAYYFATSQTSATNLTISIRDVNTNSLVNFFGPSGSVNYAAYSVTL